FASWKIIAPDGTKYFFGGATATERSYYGPNGQCCETEFLSATSWYLTRIENINNTRSITFSYVPERYSYTQRPGHNITFNSQGSISNGWSFNAPGHTSLVSIEGVRLTEIRTSSNLESIDLVANTLRQ